MTKFTDYVLLELGCPCV